jgi:predicted MFS family arabinose efflux permease
MGIQASQLCATLSRPFNAELCSLLQENPFKAEWRSITINEKDMATETLRRIFTRDFLLACGAQLAFTFVVNILMPTLPLYLVRLGASEVEIGVLIGSFSVSALVLRPFVGRSLTKIPEKNFMVAGALLFALTSLAYLKAPPFWPFFIVRLLQGVGLALFHTAAYALVAHITSEAHRGQSLNYFVLTFNLSAAMGPPLGMVLINHSGFTVLFVVCAALSLCSLFIAYGVGRPQPASLPDSAIGDRSLLSRKALPPSVVNSLTFMAWGALSTFFPLYAVQNGVSNPGLFFSTLAIMLILSRTLGGRITDLYSKEKLVPPCLILCIIAMVVLAFSKTQPMFILSAMILGGGFTFLMPSLLVIAIDRGGPHAGLALGTFTAVADLGLVLGPVLMGIVVHSTSYTTMFFCLASISLINLGYFYFSVGKKEHL